MQLREEKKKMNRCSRFGIGAHNLTNRNIIYLKRFVIWVALPNVLCRIFAAAAAVAVAVLAFLLQLIRFICIFSLWFFFMRAFGRSCIGFVLVHYLRDHFRSTFSPSFSGFFNDNVAQTSSRFIYNVFFLLCFRRWTYSSMLPVQQCLKQEINHRFERVFLLILLVDKMSLACNFLCWYSHLKCIFLFIERICHFDICWTIVISNNPIQSECVRFASIVCIYRIIAWILE